MKIIKTGTPIKGSECNNGEADNLKGEDIGTHRTSELVAQCYLNAQLLSSQNCSSRFIQLHRVQEQFRMQPSRGHDVNLGSFHSVLSASAHGMYRPQRISNNGIT